MSARTYYPNNGDGELTYGRHVIGKIIALAATEINGVGALAGRKAKLAFSGTNVNVDVFLNVVLGISAAEVAYKVQENIKRTVESMTVFKIGVVNVNILGVVPDEQ